MYNMCMLLQNCVYSSGIKFKEHDLSDLKKNPKVEKKISFGIIPTILEIIEYNFFFWSKFDEKAISGVGF